VVVKQTISGTTVATAITELDILGYMVMRQTRLVLTVHVHVCVNGRRDFFPNLETTNNTGKQQQQAILTPFEERIDHASLQQSFRTRI